MSWKYFTLATEDPRGLNQIMENISFGAQEHTMSRKITERVAQTPGSIVLIADESLDLSHLANFMAGGVYDKSVATAPTGPDLRAIHTYPLGGLSRILERWLNASCMSVVICENELNTKDALPRMPPRESRLLTYGNELYHVLLSGDASFERIEYTIRESSHYWMTGVCSLCAGKCEGEVGSEAFFDDLVGNTGYVFTPALDGEGYLVKALGITIPAWIA
jgi:hypothetical protein